MILLIIIIISSYIYRLYLIPNCLFRKDDNNKSKLCFGSIYEGIVGPFRTLYYTLKYNGIKNSYIVFKDLFLTIDNPLFLSSILFLIFGIFP